MAAVAVSILVMAGWPLAFRVLQAEYDDGAIDSILCTTGFSAQYAPAALTDGNPATVWRTDLSGPAETGLEIRLTREMRITGLQLFLAEMRFSAFDVEYYQDGGWHTFTGGAGRLPGIPGGWQTLDLSYDRVTTDTLRLHFYGIAGSRYIGSIGEVKVLGYRDDFRKNILVSRITTTASEALFRAANLCDGNTESAWETTPDTAGRAVVELEIPAARLSLVKLFLKTSLKGNLSLEYEKAGEWLAIPGGVFSAAGLKTGWNRLTVPEVATSRVRLVFTNPVFGRLGGISEIQLWGTSAANPDKVFYDSGLHRVMLGPARPETSVRVEIPKLEPDARYVLILTSDGLLPPVLELNGDRLPNQLPFRVSPGATIYRLPVDDALVAGANHLKLGSLLPLKIHQARIEAVRGTGALNAVHRNPGGLSDGWLETAAGYNSVFDVDYRSQADLEWVQLYTDTPVSYLRVQADNGRGWEDVYTVQTQYPRFIQIDIPGGVTAQRMRYQLPYGANVSEIQSWGSWVRGETPPVITGLTPVEGQIFPPGTAIFEVSGIIDQLAATVQVDGRPVSFEGEHFRITLPLDQNPVRDLTIQAQTARNGVTVERRRVFIREAPEFALDQRDSVYLVKSGGFQISGSANPHCDRITVNDRPVPLYNGRFSTTYPLTEGENILTVTAYDKHAIYTVRELKVYRDTTAPLVAVKTPLLKELAGESRIEVSGAVADVTPVTVTVNGQPAEVAGSGFRALIGLTAGSNTVRVVATDALGNSTAVALTLDHLELAPRLDVIEPADGQILTSGRVRVAGTVEDGRPIRLTVNGEKLTLSGREFQTVLNLAEGKETIRVTATNDWGYRSERLLRVLVDQTPPEPFTIGVDPAGWTSETRPVLTFEAVDRISGIAHYAVQIDDGEFTVAESPYQVPALNDGEHSVIVKAVDRAGWETVSSATLYIDTTPPAAVRGFKAVPGHDKIILSWEGNDESDLVSYRLTRSPAFSEGESKALSPGLTGFVDTEVANLTAYTYSLRAVDRAANQSSAVTLAPVKAGLAEAVARPNEETKLEFDKVVVGVPVGALDQARTITVMEVKGAEALIEKSLAVNVSPVYSISARSSMGPVDPDGVTFNKPVLVGIHFELPQDDVKQFLNKGNLRGYYYNAAAGNWEMIAESFVDGDNDVVYFFTTHFSMFSVQASVAAPLAPEQISGMGVSPGKTYSQNNQVSVSYGSGNANVTAKDFVLPGRGGLDLTISRTYDSGRGQADWGVEEGHLFSQLFGSIGSGWMALASRLIARQIDKYLAEPAGSFGFGRGWRMNFVWIEKDENGQFVHLPGGGLKKIKWRMDGPGWGGQGHGTFECHAGEHFILEQTQRKVGDIYTDDASGNGVKAGENWETTGYILTTKDGTRYEMDGAGLIKRIVNRLGTSEITFRYNGKKLEYIMDSVGRKIQFTYSGKFIRAISGAGKTVTYGYDSHDELVSVNDGGLHETKYGYSRYKLSSGSATVKLVDIITSIFIPANWVVVLGSLIPDDRQTEVYYLTQVVTPFKGEYRFTYQKQECVRYGDFGSGLSLSIGVMWFEFAKVNRFEERGSAYTKIQTIDYTINYDKDNAPVILSCNIYEGERRTYMLFDRFSNSVEKDITLLKAQMVYGRQDRLISAHLVEYDPELEAPVKVTDNTGGRSTVQTFKYDNWGNVVWQKNHHTGAEGYYTYANTATTLDYPVGMASPYSKQDLAAAIHDAKTGEYLLNIQGERVTTQEIYYRYATDGNLLEKAVRSGGKWLKTAYLHDEVGNIVKMTSPSGIKTYYSYDEAYQQALLTRVTLGRLTDADGRVQTGVILKEIGYDPQTFRKSWERDARGFVTEYRQDILGREVLTVLPDDNDDPDYRPAASSGAIDRSGSRGDNPVQEIRYDDANRTTQVVDALGNRTDYIYDTFEHLVEIVKYIRSGGSYRVYSRVKVGYDTQGNIASIVSPLGAKHADQAAQYTTRYLYDEADRLLRIIYPDETPHDADNPYKAYSYNEVTNEVTVTESADASELHETLITKDAVDRVIAQIAGYRSDAATTSRFSYDALGNKIAETDGRGHTTLFVYDDQNRLIRKTLPRTGVLNDPAGTVAEKESVTEYSYDDEGNLIREVSPLGRVVTHAYDELNREISTRTEMTGLDGSKREVVAKTFYDLAGNKVKTVDPNGKITEYTYTARGWLQAVKDPAGGITSFTYDRVGNKLSETDPRGNLPDAVKNSYTAWYFYDDLYRVVRAVLPDGTPPADPNHPGDNPVLTFAYDENGNCIRETKANGQAVEYAYNNRNWLLSQTERLNGIDYTTRFEYDWLGNQRFVYDNKGNKTEFRYDALNRLVLQIAPEGETTSYEYDLSGNRSLARDGKLNETEYVYDAVNRLVQVTDADQKSSFNYYNEEGQLTQSVTATGLVTLFHRNELGLPVEIVDPLNHKRSFDYDPAGNLVYSSDPRGTESRFQYDDLYRVLRTDLTNGSRQQYLSYEYDPVGNIRRADNGQVELVYNDGGAFDPFNRIEKVTQVISGGARYTTEYRYDELTGAMTGVRYPHSGAWLEYVYDRMGRLAAIPGFAGTSASPGFSYDENNALTSVTTANGMVTHYQYDKNGRMTAVRALKSAGDEVLALNYIYDKASNIIGRNDNSYIYDKLNRLQQATIRGVFEDRFTKAEMLLGTADQDYDGSKGVEEDVTDSTEVKLDYAARSLILNLRTEAENITRVELVPRIPSHRVPAEQLAIYVREGLGFIKLDQSRWKGVKDSAGRITVTFTPLLQVTEIKIHCNYDDLDILQLPVDRAEFYNAPGELVTVYQKLATRTESYQYDAMGNRTVEQLMLQRQHVYTYEYYHNSNRLRSNGRYHYEYDANGNLIKKTTSDGSEVWEYAYDLFNQLVEVRKDGAVAASYSYDPTGFRVQKTGSKGTIHYVQLLNGEVGYKKELTGGQETAYIYVGIQHLARVDGNVGGPGKKYYYHNDHLGSGLSITDEEGNKVMERDFAPFGEKIRTDLDGVGEAHPAEDASGFTGKDWDEDIGLYYYNARWYDPEIGRFITEDSMADDPNLYSYCFNDPINNVDPSGHWNIPVASGWQLFSATMNAVAAIDPKAEGIAQAVNMFISIYNGIENVKALYGKHITGNYTETYERSFTSKDTGIDGVSYKDKGMRVYKDHELVSTETTQVFMSDAGEVTIITKDGSDGFSQTYTYESQDRGTSVTRTVTFKSGEEGDNQINVLSTEGFVNKNSKNGTDTAYGALAIATTKQGAIGAWQSSSLPNHSGFATIAATTGDPLIMTKMHHKGDLNSYDAIGLNMEVRFNYRTPTSVPNPFAGEYDNKGDWIANPNYDKVWATGIELHSGWTDTWRGSRGCQTLKPGGKDHGKGTSPTWQEFSNTMKLSQLKDGDFIGYYYLLRL